MGEILIFIESVAITFYPLTIMIMFLYGIFEKLVHKMDNKEMTQKELEKGFMIASLIISSLLGILVLYIRNS